MGPKAISLMPVSTLWAILFFIMLILLGLDSQFIETEGFITSFVDLFPGTLRRGYNREIFIAITCIASYFIGLTMVTNGGIYVFSIFDTWGASGFCLLWVAFFELIAIGWFYGGERMWQNITRMVGFRPIPIIKYVWIILAPLLISATFIYTLAILPVFAYGDYIYPPWGLAIGWILALSSMVVIPGYVAYIFFVTPGTLDEKWRFLTTPVVRSNHIDYGTSYNKRKVGWGVVFTGNYDLGSNDVIGKKETISVIENRYVKNNTQF